MFKYLHANLINAYGEIMIYDIFICYKRYSGKDLAVHLRNALSDFNIPAFLDIIDIPKELESTESWWKYRNQAVRDCKTFLMIITKGFERSPEIINEIKIAIDNNKKFQSRPYILKISANFGSFVAYSFSILNSNFFSFSISIVFSHTGSKAVRLSQII